MLTSSSQGASIEFIKLVKEVNELYALIALIVSMIILIGFLLSRKRRIINEFSKIIDVRSQQTTQSKIFIKKFNSYIPHHLKNITWSNQPVITAKTLVKEFSPKYIIPKITVFLGDSGSGKSSLMKYLAYSYCYRNIHHKKQKVKQDIGVLYLQFNNFYSLESLFEHITKDCTAHPVKIIFMDGFDEFPVLKTNSAEEVMNTFFSSISDLNSNIRVTSIFISSRKEPFIQLKRDPALYIQELSLDNAYPRILEIAPFNIKQILQLYKKIGGSEDNQILKPGKFRRQFKKYLTSIELHKNTQSEETIFSIPFFINYADLLLTEIKDRNLSFLTKGDAYCTIIEKLIYKESERSWAYKKKNNLLSHEIEREVFICHYTKDVYKILEEICRNLLLSNSTSISSFELNEIAKKLQLSQSDGREKQYFVTRHLLRRFADQYEFLHYSFYEFLIAKLILEYGSVSYDFKKHILTNKTNKEILTNYSYHFFSVGAFRDEAHEKLIFLRYSSKCIEMIRKVCNTIKSHDGIPFFPVDYLALVRAKNIELLPSCTCLIEEVLFTLPLISSLAFKQFYLKSIQIQAYMNAHELDFEGLKISDLQGIELFSSVEMLEISNNPIKDISPLKKLSNLKVMWMRDVYINEPVAQILKELPIKTLVVTIGKEYELRQIASNRYLEKIYIDLRGNHSNYLIAYELFKNSIPIRLLIRLDIEPIKMIEQVEETEEDDESTRQRTELLQAIWELETASFELNDSTLEYGKELGKYLTYIRNYEEAIEVFRQVWEGRKKIKGEKHWKTLVSQLDLGKTLCHVEQYQDGIEFATEAWEGLRDIWGENDEYVLVFQNLLGHLLTNSGQYEEAIRVLTEVRKKRIETLGENKRTLNLSYFLLTALHKAGQYQEAIKILTELLERQNIILDEDDRETLRIQHWLGVTFYEAGQYQDAIRVLTEVLSERKKEVQSIRQVKGMNVIRNYLIDSLHAAGQHQNAIIVSTERLEDIKKIMGDKHGQVIFYQNKLGRSLLRAEQYQDAIKIFTDVYNNQKELFGEAEPSTLSTQMYLGISYRKAGEYPNAIRVLSETWKRQKEVLGEENRATLRTKDELDQAFKLFFSNPLS